MERLARTLLLLISVLLIPAVAHAQATLAGLVRDASGAVLPGVTVEATSDVLIEKVRTGVTDGVGRYQIIDLRPGTYTVTFALTGFATVRREAVELTGTAVTTVNIDMRVGGVQETVTVSGDTPTVDLQTVTRQTVLDQEVVTAVPTSRNAFAVGVLIPGVSIAFSGGGGNSGQDVGGALGPSTVSLGAHGSRLTDQRMTMNGVALSTMIGGGWGGGAIPNATGTAEFAIDTAAVDATLATGGPRINFIPRDGGNRFSGTVYGSFASEGMQTESTKTVEPYPALRANTVKVNGDFNPGFGGPIKRDKVWFFISGRYQQADLYVPGMFHNKNANNPNAFTFDPDTSRPAVAPREFAVYQARLTWQANPKNKLGLTYDWESNCFCPDNVSAFRSPEAGTDRRFPYQQFVQLDWNSPVNPRLLLEGSVIHRVERWGGMHLQTGSGDNITSLDPRMVGVADIGFAPPPFGFNYRAAAQGLAPGSPPYNNSWNWNIHYRGAMSYITGSHAFKVGFNNAYGYHDNENYTAANPYFYTFLAGTPISITVQAAPYTTKIVLDRDLGLFAQDKWTAGRWTLAGGIRYDHYKNSFPEQTLGPTLLTPNRNVSFPNIDNISWHDITPKLGASYDLVGNGKTAVKVTLNKYLLGYGTLGFFENGLSSNPNPINRLVNNTSRTWVDDGDFIPECNLVAIGANGECGALQNPNFGTVAPGTSFDPDLLEGWGKRQFNWEFSAGVQQELMPRVSMDVSYFRRWYGNFQVMDDRAVGPADYDRFTFLAPTNPGLPDGGGYPLTAFDLKPEKAFVPADNFVTLAKNYGKKTDHWNGVDITANARLQNGLLLQGGVSTGRTVTDNCDLLDELPENTLQILDGTTNVREFFFPAIPLNFCHRDQRFITQIKALGSYVFPKIDVQLSGTFQSLPGQLIEANYNLFTNGNLGRPFGSGPFRAFQILDPGSIYGERLHQFDFRVSKIFRMGTSRLQANFDLYNLFNSNAVLTENFAYDVWRMPTQVLQARFFKLSGQFDF